jgi:hypothetical protein
VVHCIAVDAAVEGGVAAAAVVAVDRSADAAVAVAVHHYNIGSVVVGVVVVDDELTA